MIFFFLCGCQIAVRSERLQNAQVSCFGKVNEKRMGWMTIANSSENFEITIIIIIIKITTIKWRPSFKYLKAPYECYHTMIKMLIINVFIELIKSFSNFLAKSSAALMKTFAHSYQFYIIDRLLVLRLLISFLGSCR